MNKLCIRLKTCQEYSTENREPGNVVQGWHVYGDAVLWGGGQECRHRVAREGDSRLRGQTRGCEGVWCVIEKHSEERGRNWSTREMREEF